MLVFESALLTVTTRDASDAALFPVPVLVVVFVVLAAEFTLLFTVVLETLAIGFAALAAVLETGLIALPTLFASLLATVLRIDFLAGWLAAFTFVAAAVFAGTLVLFLAAVLLVADLVTVAFTVRLHYLNCPITPASIGRRVDVTTLSAKRLPPLLELQ
ncbi:hypothetical protein GCM10027343_10360 [Noviherbaspirillum agri]